MVLKLLKGIFLSCLLLCAATACAIPQNRNFTFEFGVLDPNKDIEILNYRYGDSQTPFTHPLDSQLSTGHISQATDIYANFPAGDILYVKWRVLSTGKIYEDTVDLHNSLPFDMNDKVIHFAIKGSQLYVYLIEGITKTQLHASDAPDCPTIVYKPYQCTRIYPDHWKNF